MRTLIPLEDALSDPPQLRSLVSLFEEDTGQLHAYARSLQSAVGRVTEAHGELAAALAELASVADAFDKVALPLDEATYETPSVMRRLGNTLSDAAGCMQMVAQQMHGSMLEPVSTFVSELEHVSAEQGAAFHQADGELEAAEAKRLRLGKREPEGKVHAHAKDVYEKRYAFHRRALDYYARLNGVQFTRYTLTVEPLLAMLYALRSHFTSGAQCVTGAGVVDFATRTQEQMQTIHTESKEERSRQIELLQSIKAMQQMDPTVYLPDTGPPECNYEADGGDKANKEEGGSAGGSPQKSAGMKGYVMLKSTGLLGSRWDRHYMFIQGSHFMAQARSALCGTVLVDFASAQKIALLEAADDSRRFAFTVNVMLPDEQGGLVKKTHTIQAWSESECNGWLRAVRSLAGAKLVQAHGPPLAHGQTQRGQQAAGIGSNRGSRESSDERGHAAELLHKESPPDAACPIQFDLSLNDDEARRPAEAAEQGDAEPPDDAFLVRFLGSVPVLSDHGGPRVAHETIRQVLAARARHSVFHTDERRLAVVGEHLVLVRVEQERAAVQKEGGEEEEAKDAGQRAKAPVHRVPLSDVAYWTVHPDNERLFALLVRRRPADFVCYAFEADVGAANICSALRAGVQAAMKHLAPTREDAGDEQHKGEGKE